jgi:hypothetical protein
LNEQLYTYQQQWKYDQHKQIMINMTGKLPGKSSDGKRKHNECNHHKNCGGRSGGLQGNNGHGGHGQEHGRRNNYANDHLKKRRMSQL